MKTCRHTPKMHLRANRGSRWQPLLPTVGAVLVMIGLLCTASAAWAMTITSATLTADNHYALFVGNAKGTDLIFVGQNELGQTGNPGDRNWRFPETFTNIPIPGGYYLYVVAWDEIPIATPQMWIGQFSFSDNTTLYSTLTDWVYTVGTGINPDTRPAPNKNIPDVVAIKVDISSAYVSNSWQNPQASHSNPYWDTWGNITEFAPSAQFIWVDTLAGDSSCDETYVIFRSKEAIVPIPGSVLLLGTGLLGLGLLGWRRKSG